MDNQQNSSENWVDDILGASAVPEEIGPDEHAVYTAGLTHPDDLELEKILAEDWSSDPTIEVGNESVGDIFNDPTVEVVSTSLPRRNPPADIPEPVSPTPVQPVQPQTPVRSGWSQPPVQPQAPVPPQPAPVQPAPAQNAPVQRPAAPQKQTAPNVDPNANIRPKKPRTYAFFGLPHMISTVIWIALIVVVGISLGRTLWVCCAEVMAFGKEDHQVTITVSKDDSIEDIAEKLGNAKLIDYPQLFKTFATATGKAENISPGTFTLNAKLDYNAIINAMSYHGYRETVEIMFTEGYTCAQIYQLLEDNGVCTVKVLEEYAANGELNEYWFLADVERGDKYCLEGYLAPDTYEFYVNDEPRRVFEKFLDEFDDRFTDIMKEDFETIQYNHMVQLSREGYSSEYIETHKLTVHDVLTLASMVQRETGSSSESFDIASVFYNRLAAGEMLGSDATVYYAIGDYFSEKEELSSADLASNSPYNTRKYTGLPPGPICNPGTYALYAALDPNETDYMYFVYDSDAKEHLFSSTLAEHEQKVRELGLG